MPPGFSKENYGLVPCHVKVHCGLILISLASSPPDFAAFFEATAGELEFHDIGHAKIVHRSLISTEANWKLVVQNNLECYHCRPAHPTYWAAHPGTLGPPNDGDQPLSREFLEPDKDIRGEISRKFTEFQQRPESPYPQLSSRRLIGGNFVTESVGGEPVAPLMGRAAYDGFYTGMLFSPLTSFIINPDYTVFYNFIPRSVRRTDIEVIWLTKETAAEGKDFDIARLIAVWDKTLREDKALVENNQLGVESDAYRPGPYSTWEGGVADFDQRYVTHVIGR
jgi:Rieske 2Fe-2S family protein